MRCGDAIRTARGITSLLVSNEDFEICYNQRPQKKKKGIIFFFLFSGTIGHDSAHQGDHIVHIFKGIERVILEISLYLYFDTQKIWPRQK